MLSKMRKAKTQRRMINSKVAKETLADVGIGLIISFPIAFTVLTFTTNLEFTVGATALTQTGVFTAMALLRKYCVRLFFLKNEGK
jgi:hypothetical protein